MDVLDPLPPLLSVTCFLLALGTPGITPRYPNGEHCARLLLYCLAVSEARTAWPEVGREITSGDDKAAVDGGFWSREVFLGVYLMSFGY